MYDYTQPMFSPMLNPYLAPQQQPQPRQEVVKVNGENGARAFSIGPNSSALLLDESGTLVWLVTTDGAGYKTVAPFDISPHQAAPAPDFTALEKRIARLEARFDDTSNPANAPRSERPERQPRADQADRHRPAEPS